MLTWLSIAALAVVLFLCRSLFRRFGTDRMDALAEKRREGSLVVSRGEFVDAGHHVPTVMALTNRALFYENSDMEGSLELEWISEVEYDTSLRTGESIQHGGVLRLRCYSQCFEFIVPAEALPRWQAALPARRDSPDSAASSAALPVAAAI